MIFGYHPDADTVGRLQDALAGSPLRLQWIPDRSAVERLSRSENDCVAVVEIRKDPLPSSAALEAVRALKQNGYTVLCCCDGARKWPLGVQCSLLLAGASKVLDSADVAFPSELRDSLEHILRVEANRQDEARRIASQMLGLGVVGSSPNMAAVFNWVLRVSPLSDLPVLITGETGTGKELVARAIHRLDSSRLNGSFVPVNCGAINAGLAESELFGHRRGAFTGAERDRKGLVRAAVGGVLFLDEIGDLDAGLQSKLLRVLQERRVLSLGDDQEWPVDVRIIAATNRDLEDMVRRGLFRADLFHRLNVLSVHIPPLRERGDDIEPLVRHFLSQCADTTVEPPVAVSDEFVAALRRIELPGNVRQLETLVRRAYLTSKGDGPLRLNDLPPEVWMQLASDPEARRARNPDTGRSDGRRALLDPVAVLEANRWKLGRSLDFCEHEIVTAALDASSGNRSRAARLLGISPRSIFNKMRKYHLGVSERSRPAS